MKAIGLLVFAFFGLVNISQCNGQDAEKNRTNGNKYMYGIGIGKDFGKAFDFYQKAMEANDARSMSQLGTMHNYGLGVSRDVNTAIVFYEKGISAGDGFSAYQLANLYESGELGEKEKRKSRKLYKSAFEFCINNPDPLSNFIVGELYGNGLGIKKDLKEAHSFYQKSADAGFYGGMTSMAWMYEFGVGIGEDLKEAEKWYRKAAASEYASGISSFGRFLYRQKRYEQAYAYLKTASSRGDSDAMFHLADMYLGGLGVTKNESKSRMYLQLAADAGNTSAMYYAGNIYPDERFSWHLRAANAGHADACSSVAGSYLQGNGVSKNYRTAITWFRKGMDRGSADAICSLGLCYMNGWGVEKDFENGFKLTRKSALMGNIDGIHNLAVWYEKGKGTKRDLRAAVEWYRKAANLGDTTSISHLADAYFQGRGVRVDKKKSADWYFKGAQLGDSNSMYNMAFCYWYGHGVPVSKNLALHWLQKSSNSGNRNAKNALSKIQLAGISFLLDVLSNTTIADIVCASSNEKSHAIATRRYRDERLLREQEQKLSDQRNRALDQYWERLSGK